MDFERLASTVVPQSGQRHNISSEAVSTHIFLPSGIVTAEGEGGSRTS